ncbi:3'-5' exonuclease [Acinetobacter entericus]|uniref:3'-5' exonuclease n=1 Tax=Acinetobacter entericus TaxID=2989714 RepID=A0ABT3NEC2_9GAMM|nr:3'-5' exonuclease [Acinetobacter entericus]MCW8037910.1 3'-5' exonuclease [Acinetobacter entericus]
MNAIIADTETNTMNGYPIEIAYANCAFDQGKLVIDQENAFDGFFSCPDPISLGAMAVHHILPSEIENKPLYSTFKLPEGITHIIGHNIDYDIRALQKCQQTIQVKGVCTLALSRMVWPELESHNLSAMYYHVMDDLVTAKRHLRGAHNAKADIYFTGVLLLAILEKLAIKDMNSLWLISEQARIPNIITFGKHRGTAIKELPSDYVAWLLKQPEVDPYLRKALENI